MNVIVEKILELYQELGTICNSNGISYITGGQTADMIFKTNNRDHYKGVIYTLETETEEMLEILKKGLLPDRELELVKNEGRKDSIRYINKDTTFVEFSSVAKYRHPGLHIEIIPCEKRSDTGDYIYYNANDVLQEFPASLIEDSKDYLYKGYIFHMPADLQTYYGLLYINNEGKTKVPVFSAEKYLASSSVAYTDFINNIGDLEEKEKNIRDLEKDISERSARIDKRNAEMDVVLDKVKGLYNIKNKGINLH